MPATLGLMAEKKPKTDTVRLRTDYIRRLNRLAGHAGKSVPDYLADILCDPLSREEEQMLRDLQTELRPADDTPRKRPKV